jgi:hypothetical protein
MLPSPLHLIMSLQAKLRGIAINQFMSAVLDIICILICTPLLAMPWSWTSIPPIYQHYKTRHIRNMESSACSLWRLPFLKLLVTSAAEVLLVCLCSLCIVCPWKWSRIVSMLWQVEATRKTFSRALSELERAAAATV